MASPPAPSDPSAAEPVGAVARRLDPDRFLFALFAPPASRDALFALSAFCAECGRAVRVASQPTLALIRLQWWRDALAAVAAGQPAPRHETATPLAAALASGLLRADDLEAILDARDAEVEEGIDDRDALLRLLAGAEGGWSVAAGRALGAPEALLPSLRAVGAAHALGRMLRTGAPLPDGLDAAAEVAAMHGSNRRARAALAGLPRAAVAAALPAVLAGRDLGRHLGRGSGSAAPGPRGFGDRAAVIAAGLLGRV